MNPMSLPTEQERSYLRQVRDALPVGRPMSAVETLDYLEDQGVPGPRDRLRAALFYLVIQGDIDHDGDARLFRPDFS